jgi:hypothetical protein
VVVVEGWDHLGSGWAFGQEGKGECQGRHRHHRHHHHDRADDERRAEVVAGAVIVVVSIIPIPLILVIITTTSTQGPCRVGRRRDARAGGGGCRGVAVRPEAPTDLPGDYPAAPQLQARPAPQRAGRQARAPVTAQRGWPLRSFFVCAGSGSLGTRLCFVCSGVVRFVFFFSCRGLLVCHSISMVHSLDGGWRWSAGPAD